MKSPGKTIVAYCKGCCDEKECGQEACPLYWYRTGHKKDYKGETAYSPLKAIRMQCLDCCLGDYREVKLCPAERCLLWPYRSGHRPKPQNPQACQKSLD